ncbi:hypothetical protein GCM10009738_07610 [Kitasatospora viridis]|uniref:histidine kinase n=1 Tax=Kitasatospora viridis TaxID=281105 RepID=A0A561TTA1_9ACTN|nr:signal transduction histidine kinase [Kitasatospora viridis]
MVNGVLGLLFAAALAAAALLYAQQGRPWVLDVAVGAAVCGAALLRGRRPGLAAAAGLALAAVGALVAGLAALPGEPGGAAVLGLLVLGGSAVRRLPPGQAGLVAAAGLVMMLAGLLIAGPMSTPFRVGGQAWLLALGAGLALRLRDQWLRAATEAVRREERLALARELHDVVAHHITGILVQAQATRLVGRRKPELLDESLAGIEKASGQALTAMRQVVGLLRDTEDVVSTAPPAAGPEQLVELVAGFTGHGHPEVRLALPEPSRPWPPEVAGTVFRVVQESLTNIARHAPHAREAVVAVIDTFDEVSVTVTNDASSTPSRPHPGGFGLVGMRERVEALGGTFAAGPQTGEGWSVRATMPVAAEEVRR